MLKSSLLLDKILIQVKSVVVLLVFFFSLFLFFSLIFNGRIIALQCCIDFCHTTAQISCKYVCVCACVCVCVSPPSRASLPPSSPSYPLSHHSWTCCVIQQLPASYLFYIWQYIYRNFKDALWKIILVILYIIQFHKAKSDP